MLSLWKTHGNRPGFLRKKLLQQRQALDIVEDFACEDKKPQKSSETSNFRMFLHFSSFLFFIFLHFFMFSCFCIFIFSFLFFLIFQVFFSFVFPFPPFSIFFFQTSEQTTKPQKKIVEQFLLFPFVKIRFLGLGGQGG